MTSFREGYQNLNDAQRQAVDIVYGPLLVVAGPGTGKTQLLALRVANILEKTDADARSILCLTFTDSAQITMQQRLVTFIGEAAYKVSVHTFHSFASEVIARNGEFFDESVAGNVADTITSHEILLEIFEALPYANPLSARDGDSFVHLPSARGRISHLKQAGLQADELRRIIARDEAWVLSNNPAIDKLEGLIKPRLSTKHLPLYRDALNLLVKHEGADERLFGFPPLSQLAVDSLRAALDECDERKKTTALSGWRRSWLNMTSSGAELSATSQLRRLEALADVYEAYQHELQSRHLRDFDDLILSVNECISVHPDLQAKLQERHQFILVDEYQDTNGAQQKLIELLCSSPVLEDKPNLMVVGDDDQAIYGFQGANPSYMTLFQQRWQDVQTVTLVENYRSTPQIIDFAKAVIDQADYHQGSAEPFIAKSLVATKPSGTKPQLHELPSQVAHHWAIADDIAGKLAAGVKGSSMAILAPRHRMLQALVPYLLERRIPVSYERRDNVLEQPHIVELITLARVISAIADQNISEANALLPELLSYPFWKLPTPLLWQMQLGRSGESWLEQMVSGDGELHNIADFLLHVASQSHREPLESVLDMLVGTTKVQEFACPFYDSYFSDASLEQQPGSYLQLLSSLSVLRNRMRSYHPERKLTLGDFIAYVDLARSAGEYIVDTHPVIYGEDAVQVMTAHKSKGQEFDVVYLLHADQKHWVSDRGRSSTIGLPPSLPIEPEPEDDNERLRRFYVGVTRAAKELVLTRSLTDDSGKALLPLQWLAPEQVQGSYEIAAATKPYSQTELTLGMQFDWRSRHTDELTTQAPLKVQLQERLDRYHLSATHLGTFLDLQYGGPKRWFTDQFLSFPRAKSRDAVFGTIMHRVMELAQQRVSRGKSATTADALKDFENLMSQQRLSDRDLHHLRERGDRALKQYIPARRDQFNALWQAEYHVGKGQVSINGVRMHGTIDLLEVDQSSKTLRVVDYKTGKSFDSWKAKQANHQLRLHGYRRQLLFYKVLLEHSREFAGYRVESGRLEFLEPGDNGRVNSLETIFSDAETGEFMELMQVVWQHMQSLNLPDFSGYPVSMRGVNLLEADLLHKDS